MTICSENHWRFQASCWLLVERLCRAGHLTIGDKDTVSYHV
jgi:hypothetical protein